MKFNEFIQEIKEALLDCGFDSERANEKSQSFRGLWISESEHPEPINCVKTVLLREPSVIYKASQLKKWKKYGVKVNLNNAYAKD